MGIVAYREHPRVVDVESGERRPSRCFFRFFFYIFILTPLSKHTAFFGFLLFAVHCVRHGDFCDLYATTIIQARARRGCRTPQHDRDGIIVKYYYINNDNNNMEPTLYKMNVRNPAAQTHRARESPFRVIILFYFSEHVWNKKYCYNIILYRTKYYSIGGGIRKRLPHENSPAFVRGPGPLVFVRFRFYYHFYYYFIFLEKKKKTSKHDKSLLGCTAAYYINGRVLCNTISLCL